VANQLSFIFQVNCCLLNNTRVFGKNFLCREKFHPIIFGCDASMHQPLMRNKLFNRVTANIEATGQSHLARK